jgi:hypothetical protein
MSDRREDDAKDDPILAALRALPVGEADRSAGDRVGRTARAAFVDEHTSQRSAFRSSASQLWSRVGVPAMLAVVCVLYLGWAITFTSTLYQ